jgi:hypothetical protein
MRGVCQLQAGSTGPPWIAVGADGGPSYCYASSGTALAVACAGAGAGFVCGLPGPRHGQSALTLAFGGRDLLLLFGGEMTDLGASSALLSAGLHVGSFAAAGSVTWVRLRAGYTSGGVATECPTASATGAVSPAGCPVSRRDAAAVLMDNSAGRSGRLLVFGGLTYCDSTQVPVAA